MRLPWVSREMYDLAVATAANYETLVNKATERAEKAEGRYSSLVTRMLEMKREGFKTVPMLTEPLKPSESAIPAEAEFAIEQVAAGDPTLKRYLNGYAQREVARGTDPGAIARAIRYGDDNEEVELAD